jgi:hypothetical protein
MISAKLPTLVNEFHTRVDNGGLTVQARAKRAAQKSPTVRRLFGRRPAILKKCFRKAAQFIHRQELPTLRVLK